MEKRKDALVFISPERSDVVGVADSNTQTTNVKNFFDLLPSTSFAVFDSGYKYQYDRFNDVYRYVPLNGDIAGVTAFTESVADAFFSPVVLPEVKLEVQLNLHTNLTKTKEIHYIKQELIQLTHFLKRYCVIW